MPKKYQVLSTKKTKKRTVPSESSQVVLCIGNALEVSSCNHQTHIDIWTEQHNICYWNLDKLKIIQSAIIILFQKKAVKPW